MKTKIFFIVILMIAVLVSCKKKDDPVDPSVTAYTSENTFKSEAQAANITQAKWDFTSNNVWKADESANFEDGGSGQFFLGKQINFSGDKTGFPFDFYLENMGIPANHANDPSALVWNDQEGFPDNTICIGDIDNYENDDFEIGVSGGKVYAIAFTIVENTAESDEFIEIYQDDGTTGGKLIAHLDDPITGFYGVISNVKLKRIFFNESSEGGDDIALSNVSFGYK